MDEFFRVAIVTLRGMWVHRWLGLAVAWIVGVVALVAVFFIPAKYEASARIFVNTDSILKPLMKDLTVQPNEDQRIGMLSRLLLSRPNMEMLVRKAGLDSQAKSDKEREGIVDSVTSWTEIRSTGKDNLYTLVYRDIDAGRAKRGVEELTSMFMHSTKGDKLEDTDAAKKFIEEQIAVYDGKLREAENRLKEFRIRYMGLTPGEGKDFFARMTETSNLLSQARLELREAERARDAFRRGLDAEAAAVISSPGGTSRAAGEIAEIDARIDAMRRNLDSMLLKYTNDHPDVQGTQRVLRELEEQRRQLIAANRSSGAPVIQPATTGQRASETLKVSLAQAEASVASLSSRVAEYTERYNRLKASAAMVPQLEADYAQLNRDYDVNKKNYESLVARRESAAISGEMQTVTGVADFRLVDPPRVSSRPVSPDRLLLIPLALLLTLAAGFGAAYVANQARPTFYDGRALREVAGLPLLGVVSLVVSGPQRWAARRSLLRFVGGAASLVGTYLASFMAMGMIAARAAA